MNDSFNNDDFICAVQEEEAIWNSKLEIFHKSDKKYVAWCKVASKILPNYESLGDKEKAEKITAMKKLWKNFRDNFRKKCVSKSGQSANKMKKYVYADVLEFLRPTMEHRSTESNVNMSDSEEEVNDEFELDVGGNRILEHNVDEIPAKRMKKNKTKVDPFEKELLDAIKSKSSEENEGPEKHFLLSLIPQIKPLTEDQKTQLYIEFLGAIQRIKNIPSSQHSVNSSNIQNQNYHQYPHRINAFPPSPVQLSQQLTPGILMSSTPSPNITNPNLTNYLYHEQSNSHHPYSKLVDYPVNSPSPGSNLSIQTYNSSE